MLWGGGAVAVTSWCVLDVLAFFFHLEAWLLGATYHADPGGRTPAEGDTGLDTGCAPAAGAAHTRTTAVAVRSSWARWEEDLYAVRK